MYIQIHPVLHVFCKQTHFSRAALLFKLDSFTLKTTLMQTWVIAYTSVPFNLWFDKAKSFLSVQFTSLVNALEFNLVPVSVEADWSLIAKQYYDLLRRITQKLRVEHPTPPLSLITDYSNLAMSHTFGPEGFTPAIRAFGTHPRLLISNYEQQPQIVTKNGYDANRPSRIQIYRH